MNSEDYNKKPINQPEETPDTTNKTTDTEQEQLQKSQDPTGFTESYWADKRARLKKKYPALTDEDLDYELSKHDSFITNLSTKLGKTPGEFNNLLEEL